MATLEWKLLASWPAASASAGQLLCCGPTDILPHPNLALFCSAHAPPSILLTVHDLAQQWRHNGPAIMSGFQSTVENEALAVLLRGPQHVVIWLARGPWQKLPHQYDEAMQAGRLLLITPFTDAVRRPTAESAAIRNQLLAQVADTVLIAHAQPGSKTEALARQIAPAKPFFTLPHPSNANLIELGAAILGQ